MSGLNCSPKGAFNALLLIGGLAPALLGAEAAVSSAMAQKEVFERNKPHVNVGTIGNQSQAPSGLATQQEAVPEDTCCEVRIIDNVRDLKKRPARRIHRQPARIRQRRR